MTRSTRRPGGRRVFSESSGTAPAARPGRWSMRKVTIAVLALVLLGGGAASATNFLDRVKELTGNKDKQSSPSSQGSGQGGSLDKETVAAGLKEALTIGS